MSLLYGVWLVDAFKTWLPSMREPKLHVLENEVLWEVFKPGREEVGSF